MENNWFSVENIDANTIAISEYGHWESPHAYLFIGTQKSVLIDTGLGVGDIKAVVEKFTPLPIQIVITHAHWDHTGGCGGFNNIGIHTLDKDWLENGLPISEEQVCKNFLKEPFTKMLPANFSIDAWKPFVGKASAVFTGGELLALGNRTLEVIHTPGHSPGHICIYEKETGYLATGDLLYEGKLDAFYESTDPVKFAESIDKLNSLPNLTKLLPGHNKLEIPVSYLREVKDAFDSLKAKNLLYHGSGTHKYEHFSIAL